MDMDNETIDELNRLFAIRAALRLLRQAKLAGSAFVPHTISVAVTELLYCERVLTNMLNVPMADERFGAISGTRKHEFGGS